MKKIFISMFAVACMFGVSQAQASYDNCICWSTVNVNSGHSSTTCKDDGSFLGRCQCTIDSTGYCHANVRTSCLAGETQYKTTATGKACCVSGGFCLNNEQSQAAEEIKTTGADTGLKGVFAGRTTPYFGYVDNVNRSSNTGRLVSIDARLDACLGYGDVDAFVNNNPGDHYAQWSACQSSCATTTKNEYCTANSSQVCNDRCNCKYSADGFGTCNNL